jgi:hypothetical protein
LPYGQRYHKPSRRATGLRFRGLFDLSSIEATSVQESCTRVRRWIRQLAVRYSDPGFRRSFFARRLLGCYFRRIVSAIWASASTSRRFASRGEMPKSRNTMPRTLVRWRDLVPMVISSGFERDLVALAGHSVGSDCRQEIVCKFLKVLRYATCRRRRAEFLWHILGHTWVRDKRGSAHNVLIDLAPRPEPEPASCGLTDYRGFAHLQIPRSNSVPQFPHIAAFFCPVSVIIRTSCGTVMAAFGESSANLLVAGIRPCPPTCWFSSGAWRTHPHRPLEP